MRSILEKLPYNPWQEFETHAPTPRRPEAVSNLKANKVMRREIRILPALGLFRVLWGYIIWGVYRGSIGLGLSGVILYGGYIGVK